MGLWDAKPSRVNLLRYPDKIDIFIIAHLVRPREVVTNILTEDQLCTVYAVNDTMRGGIIIFSILEMKKVVFPVGR